MRTGNTSNKGNKMAKKSTLKKISPYITAIVSACLQGVGLAACVVWTVTFLCPSPYQQACLTKGPIEIRENCAEYLKLNEEDRYQIIRWLARDMSIVYNVEIEIPKDHPDYCINIYNGNGYFFEASSLPSCATIRKGKMGKDGKYHAQ